MSCKAIICCNPSDYEYVPGMFPPAAPTVTVVDASCSCPPSVNPRLTCIDMQAVGTTTYTRVCAVNDGGVITLNVNQHPT